VWRLAALVVMVSTASDLHFQMQKQAFEHQGAVEIVQFFSAT
jgi:hypothetical protein